MTVSDIFPAYFSDSRYVKLRIGDPEGFAIERGEMQKKTVHQGSAR